jgi:hypothetical protein
MTAAFHVHSLPEDQQPAWDSLCDDWDTAYIFGRDSDQYTATPEDNPDAEPLAADTIPALRRLVRADHARRTRHG